MRDKRTIIIIISILLVSLITLSIIEYIKYEQNKIEDLDMTKTELEEEINKEYKEEYVEYIFKEQKKDIIIFNKIDKKTKKIILECEYIISSKDFSCHKLTQPNN